MVVYDVKHLEIKYEDVVMNGESWGCTEFAGEKVEVTSFNTLEEAETHKRRLINYYPSMEEDKNIPIIDSRSSDVPAEPVRMLPEGYDKPHVSYEEMIQQLRAKRA